MPIPFGESIESWRRTLYFNVARLGEGGTSRVFLMDATTGPYKGISFAVKVFTKAGRDDWRINFMREIHFLRGCDHPGIVRVFDEGVHGEKFPFMVMEYLPDSLHGLLKDCEIRPEKKILFTVQLLSTLAYLASLNPPGVHRDIKPKNIFIKGESSVLGDFGLLLPVGRTPTRRAARGGRAVPEMGRNYRSPELVAYHNGGGPPPPASDVFQLGLVVAEMFTGRNPLISDRVERPVRLSALDTIPGPLGPQIRNLIQSMLEETASARPSADDLLNAWQGLHFTSLEHARRRDPT